jgi:hypothetical protein
MVFKGQLLAAKPLKLKWVVWTQTRCGWATPKPLYKATKDFGSRGARLKFKTSQNLIIVKTYKHNL